MFDDYTEEHLSSWDDADVVEWKKKAAKVIKHYYLSFGDRQWDEYDLPAERNLLRAKICFALYGPPTTEADCIENAYSEDRAKTTRAEELIKQIQTMCSSKKLKVGFIIVACKQKKNQLTLPVFVVHRGLNSEGQDPRGYVDSQGRTYSNWSDWEEGNTLPMLKYAYPRSGYYTCQDGAYKFDPDRDPAIKYGTSPRCDLSKRILSQTDVVAGITSLGTGVLFVASLFTPIGPAVLAGSAIAGGVSAVYGAGRAVVRLTDKGKHGESLLDFESVTLWLGIAATPFHFATSAVNANLVRGATANGRIFSNSMRTFATILNFTTLGIDTGLLISGLVNMMEKYKNEQLTALDCLQFSMSVFFFSHTLVQPKVARSIIEQAQNQHIQQYMNSLSDADVKATFEKFVLQNKGEGTITDNSKIVRAINRIKDPNAFFKGTAGADMKIGGRKGRTILVTDAHGNTNRMNPNRVMFQQMNQGPANCAKNLKKLEECLGKGDLEKLELNGKKIFKNLGEREKGRVGKVYGQRDCKYNNDIAETAFAIAESMKFDTADQLMSITEIVVAEVRGKQGQDLTNALNDMKRANRAAFISDIQRDITAATTCAERANLKFADPLKAVYHFRKHGEDFPNRIMSSNIEFYLGEVPRKITQDANLLEVHTLQDGTVRKLYVTPNKDMFGIVTETPGQRTISSQYRYPDLYQKYMQMLDHRNAAAIRPEPVDITANLLAKHMGFASIEVNLAISGHKGRPFGGFQDLDESVHEEIAQQLAALHDLLENEE